MSTPDPAPAAPFAGDDGEATRWVAGFVATHLGEHVAAIEWSATSVGAVWGVRLGDGRRAVVKAFRPGADLRRLHAVVAAQRRLADRGFPCAAVLGGPAAYGGVAGVVEEHLDVTSTGSPHDPRNRAAMAAGLARLVDLLRGTDGTDLVEGRPAWARYADGVWPVPHDPVFDFSYPLPELPWLDAWAARAAEILAGPAGEPVIGHSDWVWQNVAVRDGGLRAGLDWDSLVLLPEPDVVGLSAGAFTQGSPVPPDAPAEAEVLAFLDDYQSVRGRFTRGELARARAAATWVRCYNARCQVDNALRRGMPPPAGSFVEQLAGG